MGLDNGFVLKKNGVSMEFGYFRKYYELDRWIASHCKCLDNEEESLFSITVQDIICLRDTIEPLVYNLLHNFTKDELTALDECLDEDVLRSVKIPLCLRNNNPFNPFMSSSAFAITKLIRLWHVLDFAEDIFDDQDATVEFYSGY